MRDRTPVPAEGAPKLPDQRLVLLTAMHPMLPAPKFHLPEREPKPAPITRGFWGWFGAGGAFLGQGCCGDRLPGRHCCPAHPFGLQKTSCGKGKEAGRGGVHLLSCVTACPNTALNICPKYLPVHHLQSAGRAKCEPAHPKNLTLSSDTCTGGASLSCYLLAAGAAFSLQPHAARGVSRSGVASPLCSQSFPCCRVDVFPS